MESEFLIGVVHESVIQEDDLVLDRGGVTQEAHDQLVGGLQVSVNEIL